MQALNYAKKIHEGLKVLKAEAWIIWEPGFLFDANMFYLTPRKAYWVVAHYSRHVRPGMQQVHSRDSLSECKSTAWIDPDGQSLVIVTFNDGKSGLSVKYDFSSFNNVKVNEIRLTSALEDYKKQTPAPITSGILLMDVPGGAIVTISASVSK